MSDLPRCLLCGCDPKHYEIPNGRRVGCSDVYCDLGHALMWDRDWIKLMGRGEPVAWMNEHGETLSAEQKATGLYFDCETFTTPLYTQAPAVDGAVLRDAMRYRWLRAKARTGKGAPDGLYIGVDSDKFPGRWALYESQADKAIDAAIKGEG